MFAGFESENRHRCVPVVRRRDHDGINIGIFENFSEILFGFWFFPLAFGAELPGSLEGAGIDIADIGDFASGDLCEDIGDCAAAGVYADCGGSNAIVRRIFRFKTAQFAHKPETEPGNGGLFQEMATGDGFVFHFECFSRVSEIETGTPPRRLLSSAASIKAKSSRVSFEETGGFPLRKNFSISVTSSK